MRFAPLETVKHRAAVGAPLPFNVFDADRTLLLARGLIVESDRQLAALCERGSLVDIDELLTPAQRIASAPREQLPALWQACMERIGRVLGDPAAPAFRAALDEAAVPVAQLIDRDPDLAIFQLLRQDGNRHREYGVNHSVHVAMVTRLVSQRLGWSEAEMQRGFKAALTMNVSMLELQGQLAEQTTPPTSAQREAVRTHPQRSVCMLQDAGVADEDWLTAVARHHEERDGSGYPSGLREPGELATLLHRADVYTAKLSSRAGRVAKAADDAAREIFRSDPGHPITAALVKEFGIYPPGCFVTLASGEIAIVVKRGTTVMTPIVAALTDMYGNLLREPVRRDTAQPLHAIAAVCAGRGMHIKVAPERLIAVAA